MTRVIVFDDTGFGTGPGLFGKELYSSILAYIYEKYLGFKVYKVSPCIAGVNKDVLCVNSKTAPILRGIYDIPLVHKLTSLIQELHADILHVNIVNPRYVNPLIVAARRTGTRLITTLHNWFIVCPLGWKVRIHSQEPCNIRPPSYKCLDCMLSHIKTTKRPQSFPEMMTAYHGIRKLAKASDVLIAPSRELAEYIKKELRLNPYHIWNPAPPHLLGRQPILNKEKYALFIGRLSLEKGAHLLPEIAERIKPYKLHIIGTGPLLDYLIKKSKDNMIIHGYVSEEKKQVLLKHASTLIIPSIWRELFGYVVIEGFAYATPAISFNYGGPSELIRASNGGFTIDHRNLAKFSSTIIELLEDENLIMRLGLNAYNFVNKELHPQKYAERLKVLLKH
jgi:glycosyltransferase involved in cell wall biosynthesis